jgi:hypothetical protein
VATSNGRRSGQTIGTGLFIVAREERKLDRSLDEQLRSCRNPNPRHNAFVRRACAAIEESLRFGAAAQITRMCACALSFGGFVVSSVGSALANRYNLATFSRRSSIDDDSDGDLDSDTRHERSCRRTRAHRGRSCLLNCANRRSDQKDGCRPD